jgi:hypothetical protein
MDKIDLLTDATRKLKDIMSMLKTSIQELESLIKIMKKWD